MTRIRFVVHESEHEIGTAQLIDGRLVANTHGAQSVIDGKVLALDMSGRQAVRFFASWSNGYIGSSMIAGPDDEANADLPFTTIGIDLAANPLGTAIVGIDWTPSGPRARLISDAADRTDDADTILQVMADGDRVGVDCPFGWPTGFVDAITAHSNRERWPVGGQASDRRPLRLRATDRHVAERFGQNPLSVSTDRIGLVAFRWAGITDQHESRFGPIDRVGTGRLVEVYPALALRIWGLLAVEDPEEPRVDRYKRSVEARHLLLRRLADRVLGLAFDSSLLAAVDHPRYGDDAVDALLAALIGAAAATPGGVEPLPDDESADGLDAAVEGWIAVPTETSLDGLCPM